MKKLNKSFLGISYFVHPLPLLAVGLMILNDHFLKAEFGNWLTGKVSDFCGVFFLPIFLVAVWCLVVNFVLRSNDFEWITKNKTIAAIIVTDLFFIGLKTHGDFLQVYVQIMALFKLHVVVIQDVTDLWALLMNVPTYLYAKKFFKANYHP